MKQVVPIDAVTDAYRKGLAWQYSRLQMMIDQLGRELERAKDARREDHLAWARQLEAFEKMFRVILSAVSQRLLEQELWEMVEELDRKEKRRKRYPHPGGFDPRKPFKK